MLAFLRIGGKISPLMESDVLQSPQVYKLWAWFETHRKQALIGCVAAVAVGIVAAFFFWQQNEKETSAGDALSKIIIQAMMTGAPNTDALLKFAAENPGTSAGARARLLAATGLFDENKFAEAQTQFEKFLREHPDTPFTAEAQLGLASCLQTQGKLNEAVAAYNRLAQSHSAGNTVLQAKYSLADLYEAQGKGEQARTLFEQVYRSGPNTTIGLEAESRAQELVMKQPPAPMTPAPATAWIPTNAPALNPAPSSNHGVGAASSPTNAPAPDLKKP
jgi:predicted negative regulator of RcsB-dependent stress response